jgi:hypothetical protein
MATKERIIQILVAALIVASALALFGRWNPAAGADRNSHAFRYLVQTDEGEHSIMVEQKDGEVVIKENGVVVPEERLERRGDSLLVLDEGGNPIHQVVLDEEGRAVFARSLRPDDPGLVTRRTLRLGITVGEVDRALAAQLGLEEGRGILVRSVQKDSAAEKAGLRDYDVIIRIDDEPIERVDALRQRLRGMEEGESLRLTLMRRGEERTVTATPTLEEIFAPEAPMPPEVMVYDLSRGGRFWRDRLEDLPTPPPVRFFGGEDEDWAVVAPPSAPGISRDGPSAERLDRLEERLARLEEMLEKLLERQDGPR